MATKRKGGIKFQLQKMAYHGNGTYLVMEISNNSVIDFEVDFLKVYSVTKNKKKKTSHQRLEMAPMYQYKIPNKISVGNSKMFVYVLPKFVLGSDEYLAIELHEAKGSRKVVLRHR